MQILNHVYNFNNQLVSKTPKQAIRYICIPWEIKTNHWSRTSEGSDQSFQTSDRRSPLQTTRSPSSPLIHTILVKTPLEKQTKRNKKQKNTTRYINWGLHNKTNRKKKQEKFSSTISYFWSDEMISRLCQWNIPMWATASSGGVRISVFDWISSKHWLK